MAVNPYLIHAQSLLMVQQEQGQACPKITFTGLGKTLQMQPGSAQLRSPLSTGGLQFAADLVFTILVSQFQPAIADANAVQNTLLMTLPNRELAYLGYAYQIQSVMICAGGLQLHIEANSLNQNA